MRERAREQKAAAGEAIVPWARDGPNPVLVEWTRARALAGEGRRALVVGTGLGDDAEHLAELGVATIAVIADVVAPGGTLLVISGAREARRRPCRLSPADGPRGLRLENAPDRNSRRRMRAAARSVCGGRSGESAEGRVVAGYQITPGLRGAPRVTRRLTRRFRHERRRGAARNTDSRTSSRYADALDQLVERSFEVELWVICLRFAHYLVHNRVLENRVAVLRRPGVGSQRASGDHRVVRTRRDR
jgi:hypothetical protein